MFGGGGGNFGGLGGYAGGGASAFGGAMDNGGGGGALEAGGGFNAVPGGGGGFGGGSAGFGGAPPASQAGGLGGYLRQGPPGGLSPEGKPQGQGQQRDQQSLMPLTLRMLLDAHERSRQDAQQGPDTPLHVNGREISMFTFIGCLETIGVEQIYKVFQVSDGTGRITVKQYHDSAQAGNPQEFQLGEYVRIMGTFRFWGGGFHVSAHNITRVENPNEVPFHFIEVAHTHLALAGRIPGKAAPPVGNAQASSATGQQLPGGTAAFPPGAFGGGGNTKPGDWQCPGCGINVFASKDSCFKCGATRDGQPAGQPNASTGAFGGGGGGGGGNTKPGDWQCPGCGLNVFASKDSCFKCGTTRNAGGQPGGQPGQGQSGGGGFSGSHAGASSFGGGGGGLGFGNPGSAMSSPVWGGGQTSPAGGAAPFGSGGQPYGGFGGGNAPGVQQPY